MEIFLQDFLSNAVFGSASFLADEVMPLVWMFACIFVLYVYYLGFTKIVKWFSFSKVKSDNQLEFQKAKWDAIENKQLLRMGAHVGFEGVGFEFEHDDRAPPIQYPLKHRLASLRAYYEEDLITEEEYSRRKQEILLRI